jgi:hypothetical protein
VSGFAFEDGCVTVSGCELDLDRAVVEEFGASFALDLVAFLASVEAARVECVFDFEAGLQGTEGYLDASPTEVDYARRRQGLRRRGLRQ